MPFVMPDNAFLPRPDREVSKRPVTNLVGIDTGIKYRLIFSDGMHVVARKPDHTGIVRKQRALSRDIEAHKQREKATRKRLPHSNARKKIQETFAREWRRDTEDARHSDFRLAHYPPNRSIRIAIQRRFAPE